MRTDGSAGIELSTSLSWASSISYSEILPVMFCIASESISSRSCPSYATQAVSVPNGPLISRISPMIISGFSTKYSFIFMPFESTLRCTQEGSTTVSVSLFWRNRISDVTSVPAAFLNVLFGNRTAPRRSARWAIYFRTFGFSLSIVPFEVMKAIMPPGRTLSSVLAKK